ncbi:hypothetical protein H257_13248 [Aphanomyces astaci]|uniref:Adenosine kinase n=1 Tax=Aphanomyces astaci TaxID=112090 RepID=W4FXF6_APHAT|nr:hypothetical protein H257_13248 [Aphanomyces astaci]ETV71348.1 hypothetical protein H257_13248 [Aphanomyces astaci]|eukprot:XP_009839013.1 hypothetical protein H257_13248 [Aphanomyces astaci]
MEVHQRRRLLAFGNPMVDLLMHVSSEFVSAHDLTHGEAVHAHISAEGRQRLLDEVLASPGVTRATGGSALNSARTIQCLLPPKSSVFVGAVGDDANGRFVHDESTNQGVDMHLHVIPTMATSTCVCLITPDNERTLVVHRAAHSHYALNDTFLDVLAAVDIVYVVAFGLSSVPRFDCVTYAATTLRPTQLFCLNLSSTNLLQNQAVVERLHTLLSSCHVILGNAREFRALASALHIPEVVSQMPAFAQQIATHTSMAPNVLLVITDAHNPTWIVQSAFSASFSVQTSQDITIRDTTGAGDAFVGGFFTGLMSNCHVNECIELGHICARRCVQNVGCQVRLTGDEMHRCTAILQSQAHGTNSLFASVLTRKSLV